MIFRGTRFKIDVNRFDHRGGELFGTQAITSADNHHVFLARFIQRRQNIFVQRLAERSRFFAAIQHGDFLRGGRNSGQQAFRRPWAIHAHFDQTVFSAASVQIINCFFYDIRARTHADNHAFGVRIAAIVEEFVISAGQFADLFHVRLDNVGELVIIWVGGFFRLEEDVRVLRRAAHFRLFRAESARFEGFNGVMIHEFRHIVVRNHLDFANFVGGSEPVEEVQRRHMRLDCAQMRHRAEIHDFLIIGGSQQRPADLPRRHHVGMIAENRKGMRRKRARGHVKDARQQFASDFVHIRNHQQQPLRGGECRG